MEKFESRGVKDSGLGVPGRAKAQRKVARDSSLIAVKRAEGRGASLITQYWLRAFDALGEGWAEKDFLSRMRKRVLRVMGMHESGSGPRKYEPFCQTEEFDWFDVRRKHGFRKRFQYALACNFSEDARTVNMSIDAFASRNCIRRPRNCNHFRFFIAVGALCNFDYSAASKCYVPSRPDVLGLGAVSYSEMFLCGTVVRKGVQLSASLPEGLVLDDSCQPVIAVGMEFWNYSKRYPEGNRVERVLVVR